MIMGLSDNETKNVDDVVDEDGYVMLATEKLLF